MDDIEGTGRKKKTLPPTVNRTANDDDADCDDFIRDPYWSPTPYSAFKLLISARFAAGLWTTISDCDETYNYWEPVRVELIITSFLFGELIIYIAGTLSFVWERVSNLGIFTGLCTSILHLHLIPCGPGKNLRLRFKADTTAYLLLCEMFPRIYLCLC